jgi:hypothetical protein
MPTSASRAGSNQPRASARTLGIYAPPKPGICHFTTQSQKCVVLSDEISILDSMKPANKLWWRCRICRVDREEPRSPRPYCGCGLPLELDDPSVPLPEERGQRPDAPEPSPTLAPVTAAELGIKLTAGMTREQILAAVEERKRRDAAN